MRQAPQQPRQRRIPAGHGVFRGILGGILGRILGVGGEEGRQKGGVALDSLHEASRGSPQIRQEFLHEALDSLQAVRQVPRAQLPAQRLQPRPGLRGGVLDVSPAGEADQEIEVAAVGVADLPDGVVGEEVEMARLELHDVRGLQMLLAVQTQHLRDLVLRLLLLVEVQLHHAALLQLAQHPPAARLLRLQPLQRAEIYGGAGRRDPLSMSCMRSGRSSATIWRSCSVRRCSALYRDSSASFSVRSSCEGGTSGMAAESEASSASSAREEEGTRKAYRCQRP